MRVKILDPAQKPLFDTERQEAEGGGRCCGRGQQARALESGQVRPGHDLSASLLILHLR